MRTGIFLGVLFCAFIILANPASCYPEYLENGMSGMVVNNGNISNNKIIIAQYLIELDYSNEGGIAVFERIVFANVGGGNYTNDLTTWVPDGITNMGVYRQEMLEEMAPVELQYTYEKNIVRFNDAEKFNAPGMAPVYIISYVMPFNAEGEIADYTKMLVYPTYINYPISSLIIMIIPPVGMTPIITDEGGNEIEGDSTESDLNAVVHTWSAPQFKEITIGLKQQSDNFKLMAYILIGFIVLVIFAYPFVKKSIIGKKSPQYKPKVKAEKIVTTQKKDQANLDELESRYESVLSLLNDLKDDVEKGVISKEEYERMLSKRKNEAIDLMKKIDELKDQSNGS
ncbi:MAG: hypothetical protein JXA38_05070 [Methanosarcinaceae archaeon]|nr:hypothetical protein [Methanosarcinaceae archaeon]